MGAALTPAAIRPGARVFVADGPFMGRGVVELVAGHRVAVRFDGGTVSTVERRHVQPDATPGIACADCVRPGCDGCAKWEDARWVGT